MKHRIDPTVDCVFKALLGSEENKNLLVHFLNAVLEPPADRRIVSVTLLNPYSDKDFLSDKLSVVDVLAMSESEVRYQVEIQLAVYKGLPERMLYNWCDLVASQLKEGEPYEALKPVHSIWLMGAVLLRGWKGFYTRFELRDREHGMELWPGGGIHVLEMLKWDRAEVETELDRWVRFFKEGKDLDDEALPEYMNTPEMRQAMETLRRFSEKEKAYHVYRKRLDYQRQQRSIALNLEEERKAKEAALQRAREQERRAREQEQRAREQERRAREQERRAENERREKEAALRRAEEEALRAEEERREKERLLALLKERGIDPGSDGS